MLLKCGKIAVMIMLVIFLFCMANAYAGGANDIAVASQDFQAMESTLIQCGDQEYPFGVFVCIHYFDGFFKDFAIIIT